MTLLTNVLILVLCARAVVAQFVTTRNCTSNTCSVVCGASTFDLSSVVLYESTDMMYVSYQDGYSFRFIVPLCGSLPTDSYSWSTGSAWQNINGAIYNLGIYENVWNYGVYTGHNYFGARALHSRYSGGSSCSDINGLRYTDLYIVCDETAFTPYGTGYEISDCYCKLIVFVIYLKSVILSQII